MKKLGLSFLSLIIGVMLLSGCTRDADVASYNLSEDADNFKVQRKVTFINTITADTSDNQLEITAKTGNDTYQKHFLGLSPTTVYIAEQLEWQEASKYRFKITIKPSALIPDVDIR